jgi:NAD(P)-dependent dehydrogenase (short-subunit alcohol dehydrogenase family)
MSRFENRSALVTGAGSGIGRAVCRSLAAGGGFVWAADINEAAAEATVRLVAENGGRAVAVRLDVRDEGSWTNALGLSDAHAEPLRILVNCAGKSAIADTFTMPVEGTFLGMKHAIPRIAASGGGAVINISSFAGLRGIARMTAYSGSKGAIRMMTKAVALECADLGNGVRVNSVHPGVVDTPAWNKHTPEEAAAAFLGHVGTDAPAAVGAHEVAKELVPIGVAASAEEIAETVCFLASDAARHITGAEIAIDGGMTAR